MEMLVSIIVVTYNSAKTVLQTLESIKKQTYKDIEVVVTDDASKDDTIEVVNQWKKENAKYFVRFVVVESKHNTGVSANVARGIRAMEGKYYKDIAGDDLLEPNAIEAFLRGRENTEGKKIIYQSRHKTFYVTSQDLKFKNEMVDEENNRFLRASQEEQYRVLLKKNPINAPSIGLISKDEYESIGGIDLKYDMIEDYPLWIKLAEKGYEFRLIDEYLVDYRVSENSLSHGKSNHYLQNEADIFFKERAYRLIETKMFIVYLKELLKYSIIKKKIERVSE